MTEQCIHKKKSLPSPLRTAGHVLLYFERVDREGTCTIPIWFFSRTSHSALLAILGNFDPSGTTNCEQDSDLLACFFLILNLLKIRKQYHGVASCIVHRQLDLLFAVAVHASVVVDMSTLVWESSCHYYIVKQRTCNASLSFELKLTISRLNIRLFR
jgi:hypothetical protein